MYIVLQAYHEGLYGPRYQWIHWSGMHFMMHQLTDDEGYGDGCDVSMMAAAMEGIIYFSPVSLVDQTTDDTVGISGYVCISTYNAEFVCINRGYQRVFAIMKLS